MGRAGHISRDLSGKAGRRSVRAARLSKEDTKDKREGHGPRTKAAKAVAVLDDNFDVVEEFDTIWESLGISADEAANLEVRAQLMMSIEDIIRENQWTQAVAARHCGVSQPRINDLLRGQIQKFSVDALITMVSALGQHVHLEVRKAA